MLKKSACKNVGSPRRRTHSVLRRLLAMESIGTPPPRTRHRRPVARDADSAEIVRCCLSDNPPPALVCGTEGDPLRHDAVANEMPQGDEQLARQGDDHLLA